MEVIQIILTILLVLISIALCVVVLMQEGKEGGLGAMAGAAGESYVSKNRARTPEGRLATLTKILGIAFMVIALLLNILA